MAKRAPEVTALTWFSPPIETVSRGVTAEQSPATWSHSGIFMALCTGTLFGNIFVPTLYIQGNYENASQQGLDYVFPVCAGVWLASTVIFVIYACIKRNKPWIPAPSAILPALGSGILWAIAETAWSISNTSLGEPITFPIVTTVPALITTLCGVIFFKEIRGLRNYILLGCAFCITTTGVVLNALSL
nr:unnamed protein product [Spirometra erinaceieuropaei]